MGPWESLTERRIREAMEQGEFDALAGEGKPLDLEVNPYEDPELRMAHRMLKNAGMAPAWIEERRDIHRAVERARERLARGGDMAAFASELARLNSRILSYNLKVPSGTWNLPQLSLKQELTRAR
jgi:uncharacterized protein YfkK (UPF0435 family)